MSSMPPAPTERQLRNWLTGIGVAAGVFFVLFVIFAALYGAEKGDNDAGRRAARQAEQWHSNTDTVREREQHEHTERTRHLYSVPVQEAMIRDVSEVLEREGIRHHVTFGTLIGLMREGELLREDHDSDMSVYAGDVPRLFALIPEFVSRGFTLLRTELEGYADDESKTCVVSLVRERNYIELYPQIWFPGTELRSFARLGQVRVPEAPEEYLDSVFKDFRVRDAADLGKAFLTPGYGSTRQPLTTSTYYANHYAEPAT